MCHDAITLSACGHPLHITPDPCYRLVTTNLCTGLVRSVEVVGGACDLCVGNMRRLRELTGRSVAWDMEEDCYLEGMVGGKGDVEGRCYFGGSEEAKGEKEEGCYLGGMEGEEGDDGCGNAEGAEMRGMVGEEEEEREKEGENEEELKSFQRKLYTDEAYERLRKECYRRVWSTCFEGS